MPQVLSVLAVHAPNRPSSCSHVGWSKCIVACLVLTVAVAAAWLAVLALLPVVLLSE